MPKPTKSGTIPSPVIIEAQVYVVPRGRSVMNGTLLYEGVMRTFKQELDEKAKNVFIEEILKMVFIESTHPV